MSCPDVKQVVKSRYLGQTRQSIQEMADKLCMQFYFILLFIYFLWPHCTVCGILSFQILEEKLTNLDIILNCRDITLPTKVHIVKAMVFPIVTYGCESGTIKKAEH